MGCDVSQTAFNISSTCAASTSGTGSVLAYKSSGVFLANDGILSVEISKSASERGNPKNRVSKSTASPKSLVSASNPASPNTSTTRSSDHRMLFTTSCLLPISTSPAPYLALNFTTVGHNTARHSMRHLQRPQLMPNSMAPAHRHARPHILHRQPHAQLALLPTRHVYPDTSHFHATSPGPSNRSPRSARSSEAGGPDRLQSASTQRSNARTPVESQW